MAAENNIPETSLTARLDELERETDYEFVVELIDIYLTESPTLIEALGKHLAAKDLPNLTITAHTLKGSSKNLGANRFGEICYRFEELGRNGMLDTESVDLSNLKAEYELVKEALIRYKNR
jgi:HPt (histidine-containing phosphotransfer) domain-containing protein